MTTVSEAVARVVEHYVDEVFALMGNGNAYFTDALARGGRVQITALRHEAGTVASADAYFRVSRRIAVATTTFGPGYTNTLTALADAAMSRTPLVFVAGAEPSTGARPQDVDQVALALAVGAEPVMLSQIDPVGQTVEAFRKAWQDRRPVVVLIPHDIAALPVVGEDGRELSELPAVPDAQEIESVEYAVPDAEQVAEVVEALAQAQCPLILAGRGAREAGSLLGELADRLGALTAASAPARGIFAGREFDLGVAGGFASETSSELIRRADVILVVGAGLNQFTTAFGDQFSSAAHVIQVDLTQAPTNPRVDSFVSGDAVDVVEKLLNNLANHPTPEKHWQGTAEHARDSRLNFDRDTGDSQAPDGRLDPRSAMCELNEILPAQRQIVSDGGHFIGWSSYFFDVPAADSLVLVGTHYQAIGLGFPSAPGAARARPEDLLVVVTGDGGGLMGLPDLHTLVRTAASCVVLVFNDAAYGAEVHQYGTQGLDEAIMHIDEIDFAALAPGFGARGVTVRTLADLDAVRDWVGEGATGTLVVDMKISSVVVAPYIQEIVAKTIAKKDR